MTGFARQAKTNRLSNRASVSATPLILLLLVLPFGAISLVLPCGCLQTPRVATQLHRPSNRPASLLPAHQRPEGGSAGLAGAAATAAGVETRNLPRSRYPGRLVLPTPNSNRNNSGGGRSSSRDATARRRGGTTAAAKPAPRRPIRRIQKRRRRRLRRSRRRRRYVDPRQSLGEGAGAGEATWGRRPRQGGG